ncbi:MAG: VWA domain-containing protein [Acidobacteria bacterium]|nr:VWA domain-containing protein [Acidobacteriota bacterium]
MYTRRHLSLGIIVLALLASASSVSAQTPPRAQAMKPEEAFKSSVAEVIVPVTVTEEKGRFVRDLEQKDFELYDEGKLQTITYFTRERNQPVVIGFLVDLSNTNRLHWDKFKEAIQDLTLATMEPDGKPDPRFSGYMIGYSTEAELMVNTTADPEKILDRIRRIKPGGGAALFDAVYMACASRTLVKGEPIEPRRVIVIIGDGHDNSSKKTLDEVVEIAQRNLVTIYGVSTTAFGFTNPGEPNLKRLAESTGGRVVYPLENIYSDVSGYLSTPSDEGNYALKVGTGGYAAAIMKGIVNAIAATAGEITTQYILRYTPSNTDVAKTFRRIEVKVKLGNVKVRAREGYYPFAP